MLAQLGYLNKDLQRVYSRVARAVSAWAFCCFALGARALCAERNLGMRMRRCARAFAHT